KRPGLRQLLEDGRRGLFDVLIIPKLSRLGRNAKELLECHDLLKQSGIELFSIKESLDFSTPHGKMTLTLLAAINEFERETIREQMLENKVARSRKGIPATGNMPYARTFNRKTSEWGLIEEKAAQIRRIVERFLKGESLHAIWRDCRASGQITFTYNAL